MSFKAIFWLLIFAVAVYVGFKVIPIYYKGIIGLRGVCNENADQYHKYGKRWVSLRVSEDLTNIGIPKAKRKYFVDVTDESVIITINYRDQATFLDRYTKVFFFSYDCEGVLTAVYD